MLAVSTATHTNPGLHLRTLLHGVDHDIDGRPHDCMELINSTSRVRADLQQTPLESSDLILYCVGSSMCPDDKTISS